MKTASSTGAVLTLFVLSAACSKEDISGGIGILLNNIGTGRDISVVVDGPGFKPQTIPLAAGAFHSDIFPGGVGNDIVFTASAPAAGPLPAIAGAATCTAGDSIVNTARYGQVNFGLNGNVIVVTCTDSPTNPGSVWQ